MSDKSIRGWLRGLFDEYAARTEAKLDRILANQERERVTLMSQTNSLANLTTAVANETTIDQSVEALLTELAGEIAAASPTGDNPAIDALVATMQANATTLSAAVVANTPTAPSTSTVSGAAATAPVAAAAVKK